MATNKGKPSKTKKAAPKEVDYKHVKKPTKKDTPAAKAMPSAKSKETKKGKEKATRQTVSKPSSNQSKAPKKTQKDTAKKGSKPPRKKPVSRVDEADQKELQDVLDEQELNAAHKLFVLKYVTNGFNAKKAYQEVYLCDEEIARRCSSRLLTNVDIKLAIRDALENLFEQMDISPQKVLQEIAKLAFSDIGHYINIQDDGSAFVDLSRAHGRTIAIQELTTDEYMEGRGENAVPVKRTKLKMADKGKYLEMLCRYLKLFSESSPSPSEHNARLLKAVQSGTMTQQDAAYEFNMLGLPIPEVIKIALQKMEPEEPDYPEGPSDEELEQRGKDAMTRAEQQKETFLPERQYEVQKLKEELERADSFSPELRLK